MDERPEARPEPAAPQPETDEITSSTEKPEAGELVEVDDYEVWRYGGGLA
jgi:hypothetical protein